MSPCSRMPATLNRTQVSTARNNGRAMRAVAGIWMKLLGVPEVSAIDNFFELGGHSLLATQLASRVRTLLHVDVPLRQYFATPTLRALAGLIEQSSRLSKGVEAPAIPRVPRDLYRVRVNHAGAFVLPAILAADLAAPAPAFGASRPVRDADPPVDPDSSEHVARPIAAMSHLFAQAGGAATGV